MAEEVGRLLHVEYSYVTRYDADDSATVVARWGATGPNIPVGSGSLSTGQASASSVVQTGRAARIDDYIEASNASALAGGIPRGRDPLLRSGRLSR